MDLSPGPNNHAEIFMDPDLTLDMISRDVENLGGNVLSFVPQIMGLGKIINSWHVFYGSGFKSWHSLHVSALCFYMYTALVSSKPVKLFFSSSSQIKRRYFEKC